MILFKYIFVKLISLGLMYFIRIQIIFGYFIFVNTETEGHFKKEMKFNLQGHYSVNASHYDYRQRCAKVTQQFEQERKTLWLIR